jgi:hypothetical protein
LTPQKRLRVGTVAILVVGFVAAAIISLSARAVPGNPLGYELEDSKKYVHDLELYGGKANVLADGIRRWFGSLWHGKRLGATVACLTVVAAGAYAFATAPLPPDGGDDAGPPEGDGEK